MLFEASRRSSKRVSTAMRETNLEALNLPAGTVIAFDDGSISLFHIWQSKLGLHVIRSVSTSGASAWMDLQHAARLFQIAAAQEILNYDLDIPEN
jgi:hypothetical protein